MDTLKTLAMYGGVGGTSLAVLMFVFREVIRKNIFPKLTREHAYKIINRIVTITGAVAVVGLVCWAWVSVAIAQKTPVRETKEFEAIEKFRKSNMRYYSDHVDFIVENFTARQKDMTEDEARRWDAHTDGGELGSYDVARDSFDALNDVFNGQLDNYKSVWKNAKDKLWDLNNKTWISRASPNWMQRVDGEDERYEDTGLPKGSRQAFLKSDDYLNATEGFKVMVTEITRAATTLMQPGT